MAGACIAMMIAAHGEYSRVSKRKVRGAYPKKFSGSLIDRATDIGMRATRRNNALLWECDPIKLA
eukprot:1320476-Pyramimonas_sp.AAC.1